MQKVAKEGQRFFKKEWLGICSIKRKHIRSFTCYKKEREDKKMKSDSIGICSLMTSQESIEQNPNLSFILLFLKSIFLLAKILIKC